MLFVQAMQNALSSPKHYQQQEKFIKKNKTQKEQIDGSKLALLLQLEAIFHERIYSLEHITKTVEIYCYLVEQFDSDQQSLKDYFLEKIQFLLSRPETIKLMMEDNEESTAIQNRFTSIACGQNLDQLKFEEETRFNRPFLQQNLDSNSKMRFSVFKKHQAKEREICMEVQERQHDQKIDVNSLLQQYDQISKEYDEAIKKQLNDQNIALNLRMANRKNNKASKRKSNSQENQRQTVVNPLRTTLSKWKLISEIQESANFWRQSINKMKK
ncbi:unnamed protein product (macronuclear) [Paramecium tetraurelia]|uniref:Uncharacterized protein n=1 Tax=Paramecium tetraurelia TaxID=5888 RepID=A0ECM6_PARTE|nr:uncharacterized protein GSPATT00003912001 [Paramecium tetraurelia]CAK93043.1 unnamed protein product [Paramecium tetraurelia]|eukprot:XP_001460440.1 hypothetical protein (macronuclear) [Paramecium tetraurelia strain d4-2]